MAELLDKVRLRMRTGGKAVVCTKRGIIEVYLRNVPQSENEVRAKAAKALKDIRACWLVHGQERRLNAPVVDAKCMADKWLLPREELFPQAGCKVVRGAESKPLYGHGLHSKRAPKVFAVESGETQLPPSAGSPRLFRHFLSGMGSLIELMPKETLDQPPGPDVRDEEAIFADWCRIGRDLVRAAIMPHGPANPHGKQR